MKRPGKILLVTVFAAGLAILGALGYLAVTQWIVMESSEPLPEIKSPRVVIKKANRTLELFDGETPVKTYKVALGNTPNGDKEIEGDGKTPEGDFYIFVKNPTSKFYLSLGVSYPNSEDADRGFRAGLLTREEANGIRTAIEEMRTPPQKTKLGGEIYIHGGGNIADWTEGCIAMTNSDVKELFDTIPIGTRITILP